MRGDWPTNADMICASVDCLARRHESFLIARLRPDRTNSLNDDFDLVAEFRPQALISCGLATIPSISASTPNLARRKT